MKQLLLATRNAGKVKELQTLLAGAGCTVLSLDQITTPVDEVEETGTTFLENARLKASAVAKQAGIATLADDSGLVVDALDGRPGVYSARYVEGTDADRSAKILEELGTNSQRTARFVCVLVYCDHETGEVQTFEGTCEGTIGFESKGDNGFGYDPIFIPNGYTQTFAELGDGIKNQLSHRAKALSLFISWYTNQ